MVLLCIRSRRNAGGRHDHAGHLPVIAAFWLSAFKVKSVEKISIMLTELDNVIEDVTLSNKVNDEVIW